MWSCKVSRRKEGMDIEVGYEKRIHQRNIVWMICYGEKVGLVRRVRERESFDDEEVWVIIYYKTFCWFLS